MANVLLKNLKKRYEGGLVAVSDFNLEIKDKEFMILVGPSGCGKSTILRMIAGLEEITEGEIYIGDKRVNDIQPKDRDIAMVFQNYALYPHMTVFENIAFGLKLLKKPKNEIRDKVAQAARVLEIEDLMDKNPKVLSGGERQRVALGRAMVRDPKVFLMDEPLSNLDAKLRVQMRIELIKLHQRLQTTIIYVTHDQTEAMTMGTRIVVMKDGMIQQVDSPSVLYEKPVNTFVAGFIGMPPMNFFNMTLKKAGEELWLHGEGININIPAHLSADERLLQYIGKEIILGVRAEAIFVNPELVGSSINTVFEAKVEVVEMLGMEKLLYISIKDMNAVVRVDSLSGIRAGDNLKFAIDVSRIHLFNKETGNIITRA